MYWPCLVLPYQGSPSLWNTLVEVFTHTLPPPPPAACGMVDGSTGADFFLAVFLSVLEASGAVAAACARHMLEATASRTTMAKSLSFAIFKCLSLRVNLRFPRSKPSRGGLYRASAGLQDSLPGANQLPAQVLVEVPRLMRHSRL